MTRASGGGRRRTAGWSALVAGALLVATAGTGLAAGESDSGASLVVRTLSNRADLISGGDALVEVTRSDGGGVTGLAVSLNGEDVTAAFAERPDNHVQGVLTGLSDGANSLVARATGVSGARLTITNHPTGGPVFSGEQVQPWACSTDRNGLGPAVDAQCNAPSVRTWRYRSTGGSFANYDRANPPDNVATTTTDQGAKVPYVFVVETGAMNRGIYRFAMLADPTKPLEPWTPRRGWNGGVYYKFGASCGTSYSQGDPIEGVEDNRALSQGYAVATSSLSVLGSNCNTVTSAESLMMLQEHMVELFGPITHTRGKGGSGGSIGQFVVASGYPGLLQGLSVDMAFEDFWTTLTEVADCHLLLNYFTKTSPHLWADAYAQGLVAGHMSISSCVTWDSTFAPLLNPARGCGAGEAYDPVARPAGCRSTVQDMQVNVLGRRPAQVWTAAEKAAGFGFAEQPYDNTGRLYGLNALRSGDITPEQFVDLNEKVGGLDIDGNVVRTRNAANPKVVETLYRAGLVSSGETLKRVPIIDVRAAAGNPEIHTNFHSHAMRQRLYNAQGSYDNQSVWQLFEVPNLPSVAGSQSFAAMSAWLHGIDKDTSASPIEEKIRRNRPVGAEDSCLIQDQKSNDLSRCAAFTYYGDPLIAAGGPASNDVMKCALKPLSVVWPGDGSFGPVPFTRTVGPVVGQWERLQAAFPDGVCDFSRPGIGQVPVQPWTTFVDGPGGRRLGDAPTSEPLSAVRLVPSVSHATPVSGEALTVTVTAVRDDGSTYDDWTTAPQLVTSDGHATLPQCGDPVDGVSTCHGVVLGDLGQQALSVRPTDGFAAGTTAVDVQPTGLVFVDPPTTARSGTATTYTTAPTAGVSGASLDGYRAVQTLTTSDGDDTLPPAQSCVGATCTLTVVFDRGGGPRTVTVRDSSTPVRSATAVTRVKG